MSSGQGRGWVGNTASSSISRPADEAFEGVFRTCPPEGKSAEVAGQVSAGLGRHEKVFAESSTWRREAVLLLISVLQIRGRSRPRKNGVQSFTRNIPLRISPTTACGKCEAWPDAKLLKNDTRVSYCVMRNEDTMKIVGHRCTLAGSGRCEPKPHADNAVWIWLARDRSDGDVEHEGLVWHALYFGCKELADTVQNAFDEGAASNRARLQQKCLTQMWRRTHSTSSDGRVHLLDRAFQTYHHLCLVR